MDEFRTIAKLWSSGTELDLGTDSNIRQWSNGCGMRVD